MPSKTDICNLALGKLGGGGDVVGGNGFIDSIDGPDRVPSWCKIAFPRTRRRVITKLATIECPFRATIRFKDLGTELSSDAVPELGQWQHAFNLPGDCLQVVRQFTEAAIAIRTQPRPYQTRSQVNFQWEIVANLKGNRKILLTNTLSNEAQDSAFIEYVIDTPETGSFTEEMIECIATLLANGVAPVIQRDMQSAAFMLEQYLAVAVPNAQAANQRGFNNTARIIPDYSGGRSRVLPSRNPILGITR